MPNNKLKRRSSRLCSLATAKRPRDVKFSNNVPPGPHRLLPFGPKSKEFTELFSGFLSSKDVHSDIMALSEDFSLRLSMECASFEHRCILS